MNAKINESLARCLDLGIFGANRGVSGNRQPKGLKHGIDIRTAPLAPIDCKRSAGT
jgi:hypothetical protein